jgi:hypothetical protein
MIPLSVILILAGFLTIFLGFKGRIVQTKGPRCPNPRCFYPLAASLERRAEQHEGVEYGYPIVCPECGHMTGSPAEARWSYRKFRMRRVYLGLALLVIGAPLLIGANMFRNQSPFIMRNLPTPILLHLATIGNQYEPRVELLRRVQSGEYTGAAADRLAERLLAVQADTDLAFDSTLADALFTLASSGAVGPECLQRATASEWIFQVDIADEVEAGARIPIEIIAHYRGPTAGRGRLVQLFLTPNIRGVQLAVNILRVTVNGVEVALPDSPAAPIRKQMSLPYMAKSIRFSLPLDDAGFDAALAAPNAATAKVRVEATWTLSDPGGVGANASAAIPAPPALSIGGSFIAQEVVRVTPSARKVEFVRHDELARTMRSGNERVTLHFSRPIAGVPSTNAVTGLLFVSGTVGAVNGIIGDQPDAASRPHVLADRWLEREGVRYDLAPFNFRGQEIAIGAVSIGAHEVTDRSFLELAERHPDGWTYVIHPRPDLAEKTVHVDRVWAGDDIRIPVTVQTTPP